VPRIAEESVQRVAEASDIVEIIGSYFPLKRAGASFRALCPFHREKTPSFHVNPQRQSFHCFGCGAGGSVFRFLMDYEHIEFPDAVRRLAQRAGIPLIEEASSDEDEKRQGLRKRLLALHAEAASWFHHTLLKSPAAQIARDYLKSRGISSDIARSWTLGFAPDSWDAAIVFLRKKKFTTDEITQSGLVSTRDDDNQNPGPRTQGIYSRFRARVMFPIRNDYGEVIAFSGRVLDSEARTAKYVNSPETPLFTKGRVLYGLDKSKRALIESKSAIVCEGQLDLISAFESGVQNVIASQGTAFTSDQARLLRRFVESVVLCFDSDRAGQQAVTRSLPALLENNLAVRVARLPEGEDPDSLIRGSGPEAFRAVVANAPSFFDYAVDRVTEQGNDPALLSAAARALGPMVALIKDSVLREATASRICARLGINHSAFAQHLKAPRPEAAHPTNPSDETRANPEPLPLSEGIRQLCRLALLSTEVRIWLADRSSPAPEQLDSSATLLGRIIASPFPLDSPSARAAFCARLSPQEEITVAGLDLDRPPEDPMDIAASHYYGLARQALESRRDTLLARMRDPTLSAAERQSLVAVIPEISKQILDLQSRVREV